MPHIIKKEGAIQEVEKINGDFFIDEKKIENEQDLKGVMYISSNLLNNVYIKEMIKRNTHNKKLVDSF